ncbi:MAG TPA: YqgE/AlgH family protein [Mycobacteriales bacterium]|jgi:putative transcriptional regulator
MEWEHLTGRLLVATPDLKDPHFERTVVMVVAQEPNGTLGVVLNRATEVLVTEVLDPWAGLAAEPPVLFEGGPVQPEAAICLGRARAGAEPGEGFARIDGSVGTVDLSGDPEAIAKDLDSVRVFAGYAGWDGDQLRAEIESGAWFVLDSLPGDPFVETPDDLWTMVLRRQGGLMAAVAVFPPDPSLN